MPRLYIERRALHANAISKDIARHIYARQLYGVIVVIGEHPGILASSVSKQWRAIILRVQRERSSTLNPGRIRELNRQLSHIQHLQMRAKPLSESTADNVLFMDLQQALAQPPDCHTMYVTVKVEEPHLKTITENMNDQGALVLY